MWFDAREMDQLPHRISWEIAESNDLGGVRFES